MGDIPQYAKDLGNVSRYKVKDGDKMVVSSDVDIR